MATCEGNLMLNTYIYDLILYINIKVLIQKKVEAILGLLHKLNYIIHSQNINIREYIKTSKNKI